MAGADVAFHDSFRRGMTGKLPERSIGQPTAETIGWPVPQLRG